MERSEIELYLNKIWRVGRKVGRTVYAQIGQEPNDNDPLIGVFDSVELAKEAVKAHNKNISSDGTPGGI